MGCQAWQGLQIAASQKKTSKKFSAISEDEVVDYPGTAESLLPLMEASCTQLEPGPGPANLKIFSSNKISVDHGRVHALSGSRPTHI
jgi:hypothetical protein